MEWYNWKQIIRCLWTLKLSRELFFFLDAFMNLEEKNDWIHIQVLFAVVHAHGWFCAWTHASNFNIGSIYMALSLQFTRMGYMVLLVSQLSVFCCIPQPPFTLPIYVHIVLNCIFAFFGKQITIPWYFSLCVDPSDCSPQTFSNLIGTSSLRVLQEACAILHYLIKGQKMQLYTSQQIKQQSLG